MLEAIIFGILVLALGTAICFAGYRLFLVLLPIWGFFAGLWVGAYTITLIFGTGFLATATGLIVGIVVGLIGAILSYLFYMVGVAIIAGAFGAALSAGLMGVIGFQGGLLVAAIAIVAAVIAVVLVLWLNLQKYVIILMTGFAGANLVVLSGLLFLQRVTLADVQALGNLIQPIVQDSWFWWIIWLAVTVGGVVVQVFANQSYTFRKERYVEGWG